MAFHHNAHLALPRPGRSRHLLQHVRTRQNGQAQAPLLPTPPLLPHTGVPNIKTLTCGDLNPDAAYVLHYIYSYLTQGQPEQELIAMSPQAKDIISKGIGVYATPILQSNIPVAHLTTGLAIYAYLPMNPCRLPQPSPADLLFFTDASGESTLTPITGGGTLLLPYTGGHYHMDHHKGHTTYRASFHGELGAMADAIAEIAAHLPDHTPHVVRVWFVVDATVDTHLLLRKARQPLHKATATSLSTQALLLWKALRSHPPYIQFHIVKQESHRHQYGNGKVDNQAVHERSTHLPTLQVPDLGRNHTHLQHIPPKPEPHRTPDRVPEDAPYTSHDRSYHYSNPIQHLARVLGDTDSQAHIQELQEKLMVPLYHSALRPANVEPTSRNNASSSSGSNYHSSPGSPDGSSASTSMSRRNTPAARATAPPRRTGNTSRYAPSIRAGIH